MYKFTDTNQPAQSPTLASEALYINGKTIESQISGYRTLKVQGRELMGRDVSMSDVAGKDGSVYLAGNYKTREITVTYQMLCANNTDFRRKFELLNYLLSNEKMIIKFNDDLDYEYIAYLGETGQVQDGTNYIVSTFTLVVPDVYKRGLLYSVVGLDSITIAEDFYYNTLPESISFMVRTNTNGFSLKSSFENKTISLTGSFVPNQVVTIKPREQDVFLNGISKPSILDWSSDLEVFYIHKNDKITITPTGHNITLTARSNQL